MAHYLPPAIMAFFQPRPELDFKAPIQPHAMPPIQGVASFVHRFNNDIPIAPIQKTKEEVKEERKQKHLNKHAERLKRWISKYDPKSHDEGFTKDAYKTLFVGRLSYDVSEEDLKSEFSYYGPIVDVKLVKDKAGKSRGYAFVEFQSSKDLKEAYKDADGRKINGRRILVDVERGRTVTNWFPRRLAGGLGSTRAANKDAIQRQSGRDGAESSTTSSSRHDRDREREREKDRDRHKDSRKRSEGEWSRDKHRSRSRSREKSKERRKSKSRSRSRSKERR